MPSISPGWFEYNHNAPFFGPSLPDSARWMRDVLVASIYRGQFPLALLGLISLAIILKMPADDLTAVVFHFLDLLSRHELLGYLFAGLCAIGWLLHARLQRRWIGEERRRRSNERAAMKAVIVGLQSKLNEVRP